MMSFVKVYEGFLPARNRDCFVGNFFRSYQGVGPPPRNDAQVMEGFV